MAHLIVAGPALARLAVGTMGKAKEHQLLRCRKPVLERRGRVGEAHAMMITSNVMNPITMMDAITQKAEYKAFSV